MPNPKNIEPYKMKKGETLNPNGRPRKTISAVNKELENLGYKEASKNDIISCYLRLIQISIPELEIKIKDNTQPALVRIVGKAILSGKGFDVIEKILDRGIGKVDQGIKIDQVATIEYVNVSKQFQNR
jgi:hypothetical protein